jgi:hypothetical protein
MNATKYPRVNWPYLIAISLMVTAAFSCCGWFITSQFHDELSRGYPVHGDLTLQNVVAFDVAFGLVILALHWKIYRDARTSIGSTGFSQPTLKGTCRIAWSEITSVKSLGPWGFQIHAGRKRIVITAYAYKNVPEFVNTLRNQFKDHNIEL